MDNDPYTMRHLTAATLLLTATHAFAQLGGCDGFEVCFVPIELASGNYVFDNCSSAQGDGEFVWTFNDGTPPATTTNAEHVFLQPGTYDVCLAGSWAGCSLSTCQTLVISAGDPCSQLQAGFTSSSTPNGSQFSNATSGTGQQTTFTWAFGDGTTSNDPQPFHTYAGPGVYEVCLVAVSVFEINGGAITCTDEYCSAITIGDVAPCNSSFNVELAWNAGANGVVFFNATSNIPGTNFIWYFGDDTEGSGSSVTHTYLQSGSYGVCVSGWYYNEATEDTCWVEDCESIVAQGGPCDGLEACFAANILQQPGSFFFDNCSNEQASAQFLWNFGDGTAPATTVNAEHVFQQPGVYEVCLTASWGDCEQTTCSAVVVEDLVCGGLMANFGSTVSGNVATFENATTGTGTNTAWAWSFGDGGTSNTENPDHTYALPGVYEVCLTATTIFVGNNGDVTTCTDTYCFDLTAFGGTSCDQLQATFTVNASPLDVVFSSTATGTGANTTYHWDFGDGTEGSGANIGHLYPGPGTYTACLTVTSFYTGPNGQVTTCQDSTCTDVIIGNIDQCDGLEACFQPSQLSSTGYFFNNCSSQSLNPTFLWLFGDGDTSTDLAPIHTFPEPGVYTVCLITTWPNGCVDEDCEVLTVGEDPCEGFNACFVTNYLQQPGAIFFDNCTSSQGSGQYMWDFGDGTTSTATHAEHVYQANGNYTVCLTAYYGNCSDSTCVGVVVSDVGDFCDDLVACFEPQPFENGAYFFANCSQLLPINIPAYYFWDFGDGTTSDNAQPDHVFASGTYTVCLTVTHGNCVDSTCTTIIVGGGDQCDQLQADFTSTPNGLAVQFISTTAGPSPQSTFSWTFGDGGSGSGPNPIHDYAVQGIYEVCLRVESIYAFPGQPVVTCVDEICYDVDAGFSNACEGLVACFEPLPFENGAYLFENCSQLLDIAIPATYLWNFGDGTASDNAQPDHAFAPGTWTVCLTVTHGECVDETCTTITVISGPGCDPNYATEFTWTTQGTAVVFVATSNLPTIGYIWHFGDGSDEGYGNVITHLYEPPGPYEVCLDAWYWNEATEDTCWTYRCHLVDPFNIVNGVADIAADDITVFPIPARDVITVSGLPASATLRLFAADGRLVLNERATSTTHQMQVAGLASGTYVLRIDAGERAMYRRVAVE